MDVLEETSGETGLWSGVATKEKKSSLQRTAKARGTASRKKRKNKQMNKWSLSFPDVR